MYIPEYCRHNYLFFCTISLILNFIMQVYSYHLLRYCSKEFLVLLCILIIIYSRVWPFYYFLLLGAHEYTD